MILGSLAWVTVVFAAISLMLPPVGLSLLLVWLVGMVFLAPVWVPLGWIIFSRREARMRREAAEQDDARLQWEELLRTARATGRRRLAKESTRPSERRIGG